MDETNQTTDTWALATLGHAIGVYVDRTINNPQIVHDASDQYGIAPDGSLYHLGQTGNVQQPVKVGSSTTTLLILAAIAYLALKGK